MVDMGVLDFRLTSLLIEIYFSIFYVIVEFMNRRTNLINFIEF